MSSIISSLGIGSGLDVNSLVSQLMSVEQQPMTDLKTKESTVDAQISAFGSIQSNLSSLSDDLTVLGTPSKLASFSATSSNANVLAVTASSTASKGTYSINVQQLATAHKVSSQTFANGMTSAVGGGTFKVTLDSTKGFASTSDTVFTGSATTSGSITVNVGTSSKQISVTNTDTLDSVVSKINAANIGVTASTKQDASGAYFLAMTPSDSTKAVTVTSSGDSGISRLESTTASVSLGASSTLGDLRDAINNSTDIGVSASIVNVDGGSKLVLTAKSTGKTISTDNSGLTSSTNFNFTTSGGPHVVSSTNGFSGSTEVVGAGTLKVNLGSSSFNVTLDGSETLNQVATKINNAKQGVTATLSSDSSGTHLVLTGDPANMDLDGDGTLDTLTDAQKSKIQTSLISVSASGSAGISRLSGFSTVGTPPQVPQSAIITIDGETVTSNSNAITTAIPGATLNLLTTGSSTLTVARDQSSVNTALSNFITAYNTLNTQFTSLTAYDATNKKASTLTGDSTVRTIQDQLSSMLFNAFGSGTYSTLSSLGISLQKDGSLSLDSTKLASAMSGDFTSVSATIQAFGTAMGKKVSSYTDSGGLLSSKTDSLNTLIKEYQDSETSLQTRLDAIEARYKTQFGSLDTTIAQMQQTSTYLTQQLAKL